MTNQVNRPKQKLMAIIDQRTLNQSEVQTLRSMLKDVLHSMNEHARNQRRAMGHFWQLAEPETIQGAIAFGAYSSVRRALHLDNAKRKKLEGIQRKLRNMV